tara:strand:- start:26 stop:226 length:201 start_codon:yes stop_codon:yes gene_type:complete
MKVTSENENKKEFIVEVEVKGTWTERYSVKAESETKAKALWDDTGVYIESMDYQPSSSEPIQVYEY